MTTITECKCEHEKTFHRQIDVFVGSCMINRCNCERYDIDKQ